MNLMVPILIALGVAAGLFLIFFGIDAAIGPEEDIEERLDRFTTVPTAEAKPEKRRRGRRGKEAATEESSTGSVVAQRVNRAIAKRTFAQNLAIELGRADVRLTPGEFLIVNGFSVAFFALVLLVVSGFNFFMLLPGGLIGFFAPRFWLGRRKRGRLKAFNDQLADTTTMMANSLRSGYSLLQSMQLIAQEAPPPMSTEFRRVVREVGLGIPPEEALNNMVLRIKSDDLDMMVTAINIQHEVGGNLSTILETIGTTIRERVRIKGEIATLTAQQSTAGYVIAGIPIALAGVLWMINHEYMGAMFKPPYIVMPICGIMMLGLGFFVIKKITDIKV